MKKVIASMVAVAGIAAAANAQSQTRLSYEVSLDGIVWSPNLEVDTAGGAREVQVRARVQLVGGGANGGLSSFVFQPVVTGAQGADDVVATGPSARQIGPFGGNFTTPTGGVSDSPGVYGRIFPFCATQTTSTNYIRSHVGAGTAAGMIRISQAHISNWIGTGPTSGTGAVNNVNGNGGINISQAFNFSGLITATDVVVFKFGISAAAIGAGGEHSLVIGTPDNGVGRILSGTTYVDNTKWYTTPGGTTTITTAVLVDVGTIRIVPTPASLALLGLGGLVVARRRR